MALHTKSLLISMVRAIGLLIVLIGFIPLPCNGQADTARFFKNTIRINLSNPMIFSPKYNVIGYERVVNEHQSFSVGVGRFAMGKFKSSPMDSVQVEDNYDDRGFNFSVDYRFYLKSENKHYAPRGVYLGPYYAFNHFSRDYTWDVNTSNYTGEVNASLDLTANLVGLQMGYQFILWNRLSIDMILMGPGMWFFKLKSEFDTGLSDKDEAMLLEKLNNMLEEAYPGSDLVLQGGGFEAKKVTSTTAMGLRYMINLGFRF